MIVATAGIAADLLAPLFGAREGELLAALHLDAERRPIETSCVGWSGGEADGAIREIVAAALRNGAVSLVTASNPPDGEPAEAALEAVRRLAAAAAAVDIRLTDHLLFGGGTCLSLRDMGLI
jgi:DNA repair protein RadC